MLKAVATATGAISLKWNNAVTVNVLVDVPVVRRQTVLLVCMSFTMAAAYHDAPEGITRCVAVAVFFSF